jgi:hypothetical protein
MGARVQVEAFRKRFLLTCAAAWPAGSLVLLLVSGWKTALAFCLAFLLVAGDFWWMSLGLSRLLGAEEVPKGAQGWFLMGLAFRTLLLLLGLYGIFYILPKESLGVVLGIGGPLILLGAAGATATRD